MSRVLCVCVASSFKTHIEKRETNTQQKRRRRRTPTGTRRTVLPLFLSLSLSLLLFRARRRDDDDDDAFETPSAAAAASRRGKTHSEIPSSSSSSSSSSTRACRRGDDGRVRGRGGERRGDAWAVGDAGRTRGGKKEQPRLRRGWKRRRMSMPEPRARPTTFSMSGLLGRVRGGENERLGDR